MCRVEFYFTLRERGGVPEVNTVYVRLMNKKRTLCERLRNAPGGIIVEKMAYVSSAPGFVTLSK